MHHFNFRESLIKLASDERERESRKDRAYTFGRMRGKSSKNKLIDQHREYVDQIEKYLLSLDELQFILHLSEEDYQAFIRDKQQELEQTQFIVDENERRNQFKALSTQITYALFWEYYQTNIDRVITFHQQCGNKELELINQSLSYSIKFLNEGRLSPEDTMEFNKLSAKIEKNGKRNNMLSRIGAVSIWGGCGLLFAAVKPNFSVPGHAYQINKKTISLLEKKIFSLNKDKQQTKHEPKQKSEKVSSRLWSSARSDTSSATPVLESARKPSSKK